MVATTAPAALTALVTLLKAATDPTAITIIDGPTDGAETDAYLCVGWDGETTAGVRSTQDPAAMRGPGNHSRKEDYDVLCYLNVHTGDSDITTPRTTAFAFLAAVETLLRANTTLSGALNSGGWAQLSEWEMRQGSSGAGLAIEIPFAIKCKART